MSASTARSPTVRCPGSAPVHPRVIPSPRLIGLLVSVCCAVGIGACGEDQQSGAQATPTATQGAAPADHSSGGESCRDITVPGHKAVDIEATGTDCDAAERIAAAAEGRGRAAYESGGFACRPSQAKDGDTTYSCSMGAANVTFLYGAA